MNRLAASLAGVMLALVPAGQALARDAAALPVLAADYLSEVIAAARAQAGAAGIAGAAEVPALLAGDPRWVAPRAQPGIGPLIGHLAVHGAEDARISGVQLAGEAARVTAEVSYGELPGTDWPVTLDFLWLGGEWKIREVRPARRRALPAGAGPDAVFAAYLADLRAAVARHSGLPPDSWLAQALQSRWIAGGGGYWRRAADCPRAGRADCMAAPLQGAGLWTVLAQDRTVEARITGFQPHPQRPAGTLRVTTVRRSYTGTMDFDATFERDKRHGWQITSLTRRGTAPAPAPARLEVETGSGLALVSSLLDALTGPGAPTPGELLAGSSTLTRHFADSREGRKAAAQTMNLPLMLSAMGIDAGSRTIVAQGPDRVKVQFAAARGRARSLLFSLVSTGDGPKIREVTMQ